MPNLDAIIGDPRFKAFPADKQREIISAADARFKALDVETQTHFLTSKMAQLGEPSQTSVTTTPTTKQSFASAYEKRTLFEPLAELNALAAAHGVSAVSPETLRKWGLEHFQEMAARFPKHAPQGGLEQAGAALSVAGGVASLVPGGSVGGVLLGQGLPALGALIESQGGAPETADAAEAIVALPFAAREAVGLVRKGVRGTTSLVDKARAFYAAKRLARAQAVESAMAAGEEIAGARASVTQVLGREVAASNANLAPLNAEEALRKTMGVGSVEPERLPDIVRETGERLRAVGRQRREMAIPSDVAAAGEDIYKAEAGAVAERARLTRTTNTLFARASAEAKAIRPGMPQGLTFDHPSPETLGIQRGAQQMIERVGTTGLSRDEKDVLESLLNLGGKVVAREDGSITHLGDVKDKVPLSDLMDAYKKARHATLQPRDFPTVTKIAKEDLKGVVADLGALIWAKTSEVPEAQAAWSKATRFVLEEQAPFRQQTLRLFRASSTPEAALSNSILNAKTSVHAERLLSGAMPGLRASYQQGSMASIVEGAQDASGKIDVGALKKGWNKLPSRTRQMIAAHADPEASMALDRIFTRQSTFAMETGKLNKPVNQINEAIGALEKAQTKSRRLATAGTAARGLGGFFATYQLAMGTVMLLKGQPASATYHFGRFAMLYLIMRNPALVARMASADPSSAEGKYALAGVHALLAPLLQEKARRKDRDLQRGPSMLRNP